MSDEKNTENTQQPSTRLDASQRFKQALANRKAAQSAGQSDSITDPKADTNEPTNAAGEPVQEQIIPHESIPHETLDSETNETTTSSGQNATGDLVADYMNTEPEKDEIPEEGPIRQQVNNPETVNDIKKFTVENEPANSEDQEKQNLDTSSENNSDEEAEESTSTTHNVPAMSNQDDAAQELTTKTQPPSHPFGPPKTNEATQYLREAQNDLDSLAAQIALGEFTQTGAGDAGRIFRACAETPEHEMNSVWSEIIAICAGLWELNYQDEAVLFIERSNQTFFIPPEWQDQVSGALQASEDYKTARNVEEAFEQGDDTQAMTLARTIQDEDGEIFQQELQYRIKKRKKSRKIAFGVAGVAIVGLLAISGIGIMTAERLYRSAPTPTFEGVGGALENLSRDLRDQRDQRDLTRQNSETVQDESAPILEQTPPLAQTTEQETTGLDNILTQPQNDQQSQQPEQTEQNPSAPIAPQTPNTGLVDSTINDTTVDIPNTTPVAPAITSPEETPNTRTDTFRPVPTTPPAQETTRQEAQAEPQVQQQPTPEQQQAQSQEQQINDCILGYAVAGQAQDLLNGLDQTDPQTAVKRQRIEAFATTLLQACQPLNINPVTIANGASRIDQAQARLIANNLMNRE